MTERRKYERAKPSLRSITRSRGRKADLIINQNFEYVFNITPGTVEVCSACWVSRDGQDGAHSIPREDECWSRCRKPECPVRPFKK